MEGEGRIGMREMDEEEWNRWRGVEWTERNGIKGLEEEDWSDWRGMKEEEGNG